MKTEQHILDQLKKAKKPEVPYGFFNDFSDLVLDLVSLEDATEGWLENLDIKHFKNDLKSIKISDLEIDKSKRGQEIALPVTAKRNNRVLLWLGSAIAACFILFFVSPFSEAEPSEIATDTANEELLLAYLSEEDLINFMVDANDTETDVLEEDEWLYEALEDEIYNYINDIQ